MRNKSAYYIIVIARGAPAQPTLDLIGGGNLAQHTLSFTPAAQPGVCRGNPAYSTSPFRQPLCLWDKGYPEFPFKETGSSATKPSHAFKIREYQSDQPSQQGLRLCLCLAYMNKTRFDKSKRQGKYFLLDK
jgi:hypothetical protein